MENYFLKLLNFISVNKMTILFISKLILVISFIVLCVVMSLLVLLQRGEEGAFSKNRGDRITTDNKTLLRATVICSAIFFINALVLNGLIYSIKHNDAKQNLTHMEKNKEK